MSKYKTDEVSEEEIKKVQNETDEVSEEKKDDMDDEEKDDDEESKDDKSFEEKCKDKVKGYSVKKENLDELKSILPDGLSEDFSEKFDTIITGLINEAIQKNSDEIINLVKEELESEIEVMKEVHHDFIIEFLDVELDKFKESQKEAIVSNVKLERAEKFLNSLKDLFTESNVILDDEKLDKLSQVEKKVEQLEAELDIHYKKITTLKKEISEKEVTLEMVNLTKDMTLVNKDRLEKMLEAADKSDSANYLKEAQKLKDFLLNENVKPKDKADETDVITENDNVDTEMSFEELVKEFVNKKV